MPILNKDKTPISDKDAKAIEKMLKGSLEEHIEKLKKGRDAEECEDPDFYNPIIEVYQNQLDNLKQTKTKEAAGKGNVEILIEI